MQTRSGVLNQFKGHHSGLICIPRNKLKVPKIQNEKFLIRYLTASYGLATKMPVGQFDPGPTQEIYKIQDQNSFLDRHEKDHRSCPKTRTGQDSGPSPRPKKISQNPRTRNGFSPIRIRSKSDSDLGYSLIQAGKSSKCYRVRSNHIKVRMTRVRVRVSGFFLLWRK